MTKKLGEVTIKEIDELCQTYIDCNKCPFYKYCGCCASACDSIHEDLEKEIKLEE